MCLIVSDCEERQHRWQTRSFLQFCILVTSLHFSIGGIRNWTFLFVIRPFTCFALVFWHVLTKIPWRPVVNKSSASSLPASMRSAPDEKVCQYAWAPDSGSLRCSLANSVKHVISSILYLFFIYFSEILWPESVWNICFPPGTAFNLAGQFGTNS